MKVRSFSFESEYQNGRQEIRVLLPDGYTPEGRYSVLYVLPVEPGFERRFGYGLGVLREMNVHNLYDLILVQMGFEKEPWFGDHATDAKVRQASYMKEFVVPFVERTYSTPGTPEGRLLLGFSKSGWGAFSLILTDPEFFGYAASWDAPLLLQRFHYRMAEVYGTQAQLDRYRPDLLISRRHRYFQGEPRLVLTGENAWGTSKPAPGGGSHTAETHHLLESHGIPHSYDSTVTAPHSWNRIWMEPTLRTLVALTQ